LKEIAVQFISILYINLAYPFKLCQIHTSSTVQPSSSICEAATNSSLVAALLQPYGGGGVPGGVILGESTSQVLPAFTRFGPYDRSDNDSDAIKRFDAKKQRT
jgi:hypothetical protein